MTAYLDAQGFEVLRIESFSLPGAIFDLAKSTDSAGSEDILVSCTDFQSTQVIGALEEEVQKPVVTSNQATLWKLMGLSVESVPIEGYGCLLM